MTKRGKAITAVVVVVLVAGVVVLAAFKRGEKAVDVRLEKVQKRDLVAYVTASGQVEPHTKVDVASDVSGRIVKLSVKEGDMVTKGQFLLQIDPATYEADVQREAAGVASARADLARAKANLEQSQNSYRRSSEIVKDNPALISAAEIEQLKTTVDVNNALYQAAQHNVDQTNAALRNSNSLLAKTTILAPMSGRITKLAVQQGETAVPGTFSKDQALLLTISDMSVLETKVKVDETDVARITLGDSGTATGSAGTAAATHSVTVKAGETLWQTAVAANPNGDIRQTVDDIMKLNSLPSAAGLQMGRKIAVPVYSN